MITWMGYLTLLFVACVDLKLLWRAREQVNASAQRQHFLDAASPFTLAAQLTFVTLCALKLGHLAGAERLELLNYMAVSFLILMTAGAAVDCVKWNRQRRSLESHPQNR